MALLTVKSLSFTYPETGKKAVDSLSFELEAGEMLTVVGPTGSGKSTLLRLLKPQLRTNGELSGIISLGGNDISCLSPADSAARIGYVGQHPDEQIVTDMVWHELAFTLENLGMKRSAIARRVAEVASYFGLESLYHHPTSELSGGQKQLLNLAAVMTSDPDLLILDEPTAQLSPISAGRFLDAVRRLNAETGLTVIIAEHRADELIPISDKLLILDGRRVSFCGSPGELSRSLNSDSPYLRYLPCPAQLWAMTGGGGECPLTVSEGKRYVRDDFDNKIRSLSIACEEPHGDPALELRDVYFRYDKTSPDVLRGLTLDLYSGEILAVAGENGAGKSTVISVAAGLRKPYSGRIKLFGRPLKDYRNGSLYEGNISLLPQDTESVFIHPTVREELKGCDAAERRLPFDFAPLYDRHPYDLSGGERQMVALCKALSTDPRVLLLDEPSKGLDPYMKLSLADTLISIKEEGVAILMVSHDTAFASMCADRCALLFDGAIAACEPTADFMSSNRFYTTAASRITRGHYDNAYTPELAAELMKMNGRPT